MKTSLKLQVCLIFLFCFMWQSTYSQILYKDDRKGEYLPPYDPNVVVISPDVEKWMNEQLTKESEKRTVEMKTDVLGRVKSITDKTEPKTKVAESKQKRLVSVSDMHLPESKTEPMSGRIEYNTETKAYNYYLNDKKVSAEEYESLMAKAREKSEPRKGKRNISVPGVISSRERGWTAWMTAEEISKLTNTYKEISIEDYREPVELASVSSILSRVQIPIGNKGSGINVCVIEVGCMDTNIPILNSSNYTSRCNGTARPHHTMVANVVQHSATNAKVYGYGIGKTSIPVSNSTPIPPYSASCHIETRSYGSNTNSYNNDDEELDNHIYNAPDYKSPINFVAAGNDSNAYVASPAKAVNAITVGAVAPATDNYANYSTWRNPGPLYNEKPEVGMFTDIDMGIYGFIDGTSAATPLAAGLATNLLSNFILSTLPNGGFFNGQPALVKAALIVGEEIPIKNATSGNNTWDTDNRKVAQKVPTYNGITSFKAASWWNKPSSFLNNDLVITENVTEAGTYKIAIAWLSSGSYIKSNQKLPQDIDLSVSQNGRTLSSTSWTNPFEVVTFDNVTPNAPLTIRIYRYSGSEKVLLGYAIRKVQ